MKRRSLFRALGLSAVAAPAVLTSAASAQILDLRVHSTRQTRSVKMFGAAGNCTAAGTGKDDSAAIQRAFDWVAGGPNRELVFPPGYRWRVSNPCTLDFGGLTVSTHYRGQRIIMHSPITPDASALKAFTLYNGYDVLLELRCLEGGQDADYTEADPSGDATAFTLRGMRNPRISVWGRNFAGRLLRIPKHVSGEPKMSFVTMDYFSHESHNIGQPFFIDCETDAFGHIEELYGLYGKYGGKFIDTSDISISRIAGGDASAMSGVAGGIEFRGCVSLWIDTIDSGDISNNITGDWSENTADLLTIRDNPDSGKETYNISITKAFLNTAGRGLVAENVSTGNTNRTGMHIGYLSTLDSTVVGAELINCRGVKIDRHVSRSDAKSLKISGSDSEYIEINCSYRNVEGTAIEIADDARGSVFTGHIVEANTLDAADTPVVKIANTTSRISFIGFTNFSDKGNYSFDLPSNNNVHIIGGEVAIASGGAKFSVNRPKRTDGLVGYRTYARGQTTVPNGASSVIGIAHTLAVAPAIIHPISRDANNTGFVANSIGAITFNLVRASPVSANTTVDWIAYASEEFG